MEQIWQSAVVGLQPGAAYALIAVGLVLIYRGSGVLNFAQGTMAMVGAYTFYEAHDTGSGLGVIPSLIIAAVVGALVGVLVYLLVIRWLLGASEMVKVIATLGVLSTLQGLAVIIFGIESRFVGPVFTHGLQPGFTFLGATVELDTVVILGLIVVVCILSVLLFNRTRFGAKATALRENPMAAAAVGISPHPIGLGTWALGGAVGAVAGALLAPATGLSPTTMTLLVVPALAAGLLRKFSAIPLAAVIGLVIGIVQSELQLQLNISPDYTQAIPFIVIIGSLVIGGQALPSRGWSELARLPRASSGQRRFAVPLIICALAVVASQLIQGAFADAVIVSAVVGMLGLSVTVVTGLAGQMSLAPFALAGVGALTAAKLAASWQWPFLPAVLFSGLLAALVGIVIGMPAVRVRGVNLAIATVGLALLVEESVLSSPWATNNGFGITIAPPSLFGLAIDPAAHGVRYATVCIVVLLLFGYAVVNIRRRTSGRRYLAVRANERGAASLGIWVPEAKLAAFAVSAFIAGIAGGLTTFEYTNVTLSSGFDILSSFTLVSVVVIAGVGYITGGAIAGVLLPGGVLSYIIAVKLGWTSVNEWMPVLFGVWVISAVVQSPDGFVKVYAAGLARLGGPLGRYTRRLLPERSAEMPRSPIAARLADTSSIPLTSLVPVPRERRTGEVVLRASGLTVQYGGVTAIRDVDLEVSAGVIFGVIGPNGAGKTTLIDALTGFGRVTTGHAEFAGVDVTGLAPHQRARQGLARTFQNLELFEDITVRENLLAAAEVTRRRVYVTDVFAGSRSRLSPEALEVIRLLRLEEYLDAQVSDLPQGIRRLVAIARVASQHPRLMCLDEPAAGLGSTERSLLSSSLLDLAGHLGIAMVLVEHNIDIIADVCDEVMALDFGLVIARGTPGEVLSDPLVRSAYLGEPAEEQVKGQRHAHADAAEAD